MDMQTNSPQASVAEASAADRIAELEAQLEEAHRKLGTDARSAAGSSRRVDRATAEKGHDGPFDPWEKDHTALVHVLWDCKADGLNLHGDFDEIATRIRQSRWMTAQRDDAIQTGDPKRR
ncbi:hypothetical protein ACFVAJ_17355 [Agromyces sp. NPDC057679]|uniref:hypothetical protein n=1 Tax=Agromyces sp. NPDC057679 TaxID=3346207 RepID=UPI00366C8DDB